jgi:glycosyltransferase involved in cell wall biosynthesis
MEVLSYGDAVSNIARANARLLSEMGHHYRIISAHSDPRVSREVCRLEGFEQRGRQALVYHYWGFSQLEEFITAFNGPKAIYYHNITPPGYFPPDSVAFEQTMRGTEQLRRIADLFNIIVAPSEHNLEELASLVTEPKPTVCIPPAVDRADILARPADRQKLKELQAMEDVRFLFVGRVTPNKRQDQLMRMFDYYYRNINHHARLFLVGDTRHTPNYFQELEVLRRTLPSRERIIFTGHVSNESITAYYRAADVFVCASEHEGFCVPVAEAMAYGLPVVALSAAAVPETLGGAGLLVRDWDPTRVAELVNVLLKDQSLRSGIVERQRASLSRFSKRVVQSRLAALCDFLCSGREDPLFVRRGGVRATQTTNGAN